MRFVMFYHSLLSDWNHGNAHFLRGVSSELIERGHEVRIFEPLDAWSRTNLVREHGLAPLWEMRSVYPRLRAELYWPERIDLSAILDEADVVVVHEWNDHELVGRIGRHRKTMGEYCLFFHDTHHRSVTDPAAMGAYDLSHYDGVLAFGGTVRDIYLRRRWARQAWTWHESADVRVFKPIPEAERTGDLVWIGNWGDEERTEELQEFLIDPVCRLGLRATVYGVRYPDAARKALAKANISYGGWLPNYRVPEVFARFRVTVHVPRRPYAQALPGIPTIRMFEALACGIPLVSAPWSDSERLFNPPHGFLFARDGAEMTRQLERVLTDRRLAQTLGQAGRRCILARHTCGHRVDQLLNIVSEIRSDGRTPRMCPSSRRITHA